MSTHKAVKSHSAGARNATHDDAGAPMRHADAGYADTHEGFEEADEFAGADEEDEEDESFDKVAASDTDDSNTKLFREDPVLDRRIIEGMLKDRNAFLDEMAREGYGQAAV